MSRRGLTDALAALGLLLAAGCASVAPAPESEVPSGPPPEVVARYDAAVASLAAGDEAAALPVLMDLSASHPEYAGPTLNLALISARNGRDEEAMALFRQAAIVCSQCAPVWNGLGAAQRRAGQFTDAEQSYRRAIDADAGYAPAYYNLAILYELYSQRPDLALDYYQRYLALAADDAGAPEVEKWVTDLKRRVAATPVAARSEAAP